MYQNVVFPGMVVSFGVLIMLALVTLVWWRTHPWIKRAVTLIYVVSIIQAIAVIVAIINGVEGEVLTVWGYLLVSLMLLPMFGLGRLGDPDIDPESSFAQKNPDRPILAADQIARVDAVSALILGISLVTVSWRLHDLIGLV